MKIVFGVLGDRFGAKRVLVTGLLLQAFGALAYFFVSELAAFYVVAAAFGFIYLKSRLPRVALPDVGGAYRQWQLRRAKKKFQVYMKKNGGRGPWVN